MTKQEFVRMHSVAQMPRVAQVLIGKLWDAAHEAGQAEGYRKGIDAVAREQEKIYTRMYEEGAKDATKRGSAAFSAAVCKALHELYGFGAVRCGRVVDEVAKQLVGMIDPAETIRELREWGVEIEWEDPLEEVV